MELKQDLIPASNANRPQTFLDPSYLTIHETGNRSVGANAAMHAIYVKGQDAIARQVSWHITVDEREAIQHLPFNEVGWHAGREGNHHSIGIEICVNQDGDFQRARANAISVVQQLMRDLSLSIDDVVTHQKWTGKNCPENLLKSWDQFKQDVQGGGNPPAPPIEGRLLRVIADTLWVYDRPDWQARYTTVSKNEVFTIAERLLVNGSVMYRLKSGLFITGNPLYVQLI